MKKILLIVSITIGLMSQTFADTGIVKWFNGQKGYGFIQSDNGTIDIFIHISAVQKAGLFDLEEGTKLRYEVIENNGKKSAENIQIIE